MAFPASSGVNLRELLFLSEPPNARQQNGFRMPTYQRVVEEGMTYDKAESTQKCAWCLGLESFPFLQHPPPS